MSATKAYACDRDGCTELTHREEGERYPKHWKRIAITIDDKKLAGSFHNNACALAWLQGHVNTFFEQTGGHGRPS